MCFSALWNSVSRGTGHRLASFDHNSIDFFHQNFMPSLYNSVTFGLKPFSDSKRKRPNFGNIDLEHRRITMVQMWEIVGGADKGGIIVRHVEMILMSSSALVLCGMLCFLFLFPLWNAWSFFWLPGTEKTLSRISWTTDYPRELWWKKSNWKEIAWIIAWRWGQVLQLAGSFGRVDLVGSQICLFIHNLFLISSLQSSFVDYFTDVKRTWTDEQTFWHVRDCKHLNFCTSIESICISLDSEIFSGQHQAQGQGFGAQNGQGSTASTDTGGA